MKRKMLLMFCITTFCLSGAPAFADMFDFDADLSMTFNLTTATTGTMGASIYNWGSLRVNRLEAPLGTAEVGLGYFTSGDLSLSMAIANIDNTAETATGTGNVTLTDIDGDTITGDLSGSWAMVLDYPTFTGSLTNVQWTSDDGLFNGDSGAVALDLTTSPPWAGPVELTIDHAAWVFWASWAKAKPGSINAVVPAPTAVLLGILGLGAVGIKLRKYA